MRIQTTQNEKKEKTMKNSLMFEIEKCKPKNGHITDKFR